MLLRLNSKHPFWTAKQLVEKLHDDAIKALSNRPVGHLFVVLSIKLADKHRHCVSFTQVPYKPNVRTVQRFLNISGVGYCKASRKPLLTQRHMAQRCFVPWVYVVRSPLSLYIYFRLTYAKKYLDKGFTNVVFSDEKMFRFRPGMSVGVWRPKGADRYSAKYTIKTTQKGDGVMAWAAINSKGEVIVRRCPKKMKASATAVMHS